MQSRNKENFFIEIDFQFIHKIPFLWKMCSGEKKLKFFSTFVRSIWAFVVDFTISKWPEKSDYDVDLDLQLTRYSLMKAQKHYFSKNIFESSTM